MNNSGVRASGQAQRGGGPRTGPRRGAASAQRGAGVRRAARFAAGALGASVIALAVGACAPSVPAFDPRTFDRGARSSAAELQDSKPAATLPTTLQTTSVDRPQFGTVDPDAPIVRLSLQEVIQRAAANNKEARVAGYEPAIEETRQVEAEARFDPAFFLNGSYEVQRILSPQGGQEANPFSPREFRTLSGQTGIRQLLPTGAQTEWSYRVQSIQGNQPGGFQFIP